MGKGIDENLSAIISEAVQAKVDAAVMEALSGDDVMGRYITAALQEEVKGGYSRDKQTFLQKAIKDALQKATEVAVNNFIEGETKALESLVEKELKKQSKSIAAGMVDSLAEQAKSQYRMNVSVTFPGRDDS